MEKVAVEAAMDQDPSAAVHQALSSRRGAVALSGAILFPVRQASELLVHEFAGSSSDLRVVSIPE
jgi:hypothetical protein